MDDQLVNMQIDPIADSYPCRLRLLLVLCLLASARLHLLNASSTLCLHVFADVHSFGTKHSLAHRPPITVITTRTVHIVTPSREAYIHPANRACTYFFPFTQF